MRLWTTAALLLLPATAVAQAPAYMMETKPTHHVEATMIVEVSAPNYKAKEWMLVIARMPELPGQAKVKSSLNYPGENFEDLSPYKRPLLRSRVKVKAGTELETKITIRATYEAELSSRTLVLVPEGEKPPKVEPLSAAERKLYLRSTPILNFDAAGFKKWLADNDLVKKKDESDLEYGKRVFVHIVSKFDYEYRQQVEWTASEVCKAGKSECGGLSTTFTAALRSQGIPTRIRVGRWAMSAKKGDRIGEVGFLQQHMWPEFYCAGIGWVPVDPSVAITSKAPDPVEWFGKDLGLFLTLHLDPEVVFDSVFAGKKTELSLQSAGFFVNGTGQLDKVMIGSDWLVRKVGK
jgi:hypothetical protein